MANKFHTCSLRCVFVHVQKVNCPAGAREATLGCAAAKNDFYGFAAFAANSAKLFLQSERKDNDPSSYFCCENIIHFYDMPLHFE